MSTFPCRRAAALLSFLILSPILPAAAEELWPDLSSTGKAVGGGEKDAAVIVGAEDYFTVEKVPGARRNAEDWQSYLTGALKVPADRVALLRDHEATLEKMRKYAAQAAADAQPGGTLWFVFIGHGAPSKDGKDGLLVGVDAQQDVDSLYARSLGRGELLGLLSKGKQAKTIVLLDACFSGRSSSGKALVGGLQPLVLMKDQAAGDPRLVLLTAGKSDQFAGPLPKAGTMRPAFSYLALGALRGWAADRWGKVTAGALVDYAQKGLKLAHDRIQTPEIAVGSADMVLGVGRERSPDLARIARENAGNAPPAKSQGFEVSHLPSLPTAEAPRALDSSAPGLDWQNVDVDALEKYNAAFKLDKGAGTPQEKAAAWRALAGEAPKFAELARKRAAEWDTFAAQQKALEEAKRQRIKARDADWRKLERLLALDVVPETDKKRWAIQFVNAYRASPGLEPMVARELIVYLPPSPDRFALERLLGPAPAEKPRKLKN